MTGAPQSGKSILLRTLITSMALTHTPQDVQIYGIDHGGGGLASIAGLPHVGGIATRLERERVRRILSELADLLARREALFAERGIDSVSVFRSMRAAGELPEEPLGDVFLVIDNFGAMRSEMDDADELVFDLASRGLGYGLHVVIATNRANDMRINLRDTLGSRVELRIGDPMDSEVDRKASELLAGSPPGRGLTTGKLFFQVALPRADGVADPLSLAKASEHLAEIAAREWTGPRAPEVRMLPPRVDAAALPPSMGEPGVVVGVSERNLGPVRLDLRGGDPHFLVYGDSESGKTAFLRTYLRGLVASEPPTRAKVVMVDLRRTLLEVVPESHLASYSGSLAQAGVELTKLRNSLIERLPPVDVTVSQLRDRSWWSGPDVYVVVDDYDLVVTPAGNPLAPLLELVPQARDVGLHIIAARRVAGAGRSSFEPFLQRVREMGEQGLILAGDHAEGQILGGVRAAPHPPGRGTLVRRRAAPELIQVAWTPDHLPVA